MEEQKDKIKNYKVGLTVFAGLLIIFILLIIVGTDDYFFSKTYSLKTYVTDAAGLVKGAPVMLGGIKAGDVEKIDFVPGNEKSIICISLRVLSSYQNKITASSRAEIKAIGILGDKLVYITVGKPNEIAVAEGSTIPFNSTLGFEDISQSLSPAVVDLKGILLNLHKITDTIAAGKGSIGALINEPATVNGINRVINKIDNILSSFENKNNSLGELINDKELYNNLVYVIKDLKGIVTDLRDGKGTLGKLVVEDSLYNNINSSAAQLKGILSKVQSDSTFAGGLLNDKKLYHNLNDLIKDINNLVNDIKENPDRYVKVKIF
jgi:phospholipid/cholesterol/gamma-HCH transport system substrate-binding protein